MWRWQIIPRAFVNSEYDLTNHLLPWAIDPNVFRDSDEQWYLYMTVEYWDDPAGFIGSGNVIDRLLDPFTLESKMTRVTPPCHDWQLFEAKPQAKGGIDWYTVEGLAVIHHRRRYYEMYSGGRYYRDNYAVSYATSDTQMGTGGRRDGPEISLHSPNLLTFPRALTHLPGIHYSLDSEMSS